MNTKKTQEQTNLEDEYMRIMENEEIYLDEIKFLDKIETITSILFLVFTFPTLAFILFLSPMLTDPVYITYEIYLFVFGVCPFVFSVITSSLTSRKISRIDSELGLTEQENLYMMSYDASLNIDSYVKEENKRRKTYFRKLALKSVKKIVKKVNTWNYGNINLIKDIIGNQIDLLKNNMERLLLSNVAKGDEATLTEISKILIEFCKYVLSPSVKKLNDLNNMIKELPYTKYEVSTAKQRFKKYFHDRPRFCRLLFASVIVGSVIAVMLSTGQDVGLTIAVAVACLWGAIASFDKIFRFKEK